MRYLVLLVIISLFPHVVDAALRKYPSAITEQEKANIRFIIGTLATTSSVGLLFKKKALEAAGDRTEEVHPLNYIGYIFSDPVLKQQAKKINGIAWSRFVQGMSGSFEKAEQRHNIPPQMIDYFAKQVNVDSNILIPYFKKEQWGDLINVIRKKT